MHIASGEELMIFSGEYGYSTGISKKTQDGEYIRTYIPVSFKKGITIENQTKIKVIDSWLSLYERKADNKKVLYIFVNDFEEVK